MTATNLQLVRVVVRGATQPGDSATLGNVEYRRETTGPGEPQAIYFTALKPRRRDNVSYTQRDDERMKITGTGLPLSKSVAFEFCGTDIDLMIASAGAQQTVAGAVLQIQPLLEYFQQNFSVA